jgi:hypothetical protein
MYQYYLAFFECLPGVRHLSKLYTHQSPHHSWEVNAHFTEGEMRHKAVANHVQS